MAGTAVDDGDGTHTHTTHPCLRSLLMGGTGRTGLIIIAMPSDFASQRFTFSSPGQWLPEHLPILYEVRSNNFTIKACLPALPPQKAVGIAWNKTSLPPQVFLVLSIINHSAGENPPPPLYRK